MQFVVKKIYCLLCNNCKLSYKQQCVSILPSKPIQIAEASEYNVKLFIIYTLVCVYNDETFSNVS